MSIARLLHSVNAQEMSSVPIRLLRRTVAVLASRFGGRVSNLSVTSLTIGGVSARLYTPPTIRAGPAIVFFHGGGFISCGLETHDALCRQICETSELQVISAAYRLAPEHPAPAQLEDALAVCSWVLGSPAELVGNTEQIILSGDSAGGYLAVRCGIALNEKTKRVAAQLLFYPLIDLDVTKSSGSGLVARSTGMFIRSQLGAKSYPSLTSFNLGNLPKTIVVGGRLLDPVHSQNKAFVELLKEASIPVEHIIFPRLLHGALNLSRISQTARAAVKASIEALK